MRNDIERARHALQAIDPNCDRTAWVKTGMAAHAAGLSFDDFDQWSQPAESYNQTAARTTWRSFKSAPGGVSAGALFGMARDHGWTDGDRPARPAPERTRKPAEPPRKPAKGNSAAEVWARATDALEHGYADRKGAGVEALQGLRVLPQNDPLRIGGASMAGALVLPAYAPDGALQSLQLIPPEGKKMNLPGHPMSGASFTVGTSEPGKPIYICEGIGQAWACWQSTGCAAVVTFGSGNMGKVTAALRQQDDAAMLVLVPDVGREQDAAAIAAQYRAAVVTMPEGEPQNFDANDLMVRDGAEALAALLAQAVEPPKPEPLLKPVSVNDVLTKPSEPPAFVWDGYLPRGVVSLLGAHGGTGKSTAALMLAVCVATGRPLFGVATQQGLVLFASFEDAEGIVRHRLGHICKTWGIDPATLGDRLVIVDGTAHPELFAADRRDGGDVTSTYAELRKLAQGVDLVVIDNASDAYGGDEIQRRQVRAFIRALGAIAKASHAAVLLLAHVDKGTSRARKAEGAEGYSGSTAWHNSVRSRLFMSRDEAGTLTLEHQKSNLAKMCEPITLVWPDGGLPMLVSDAPDVSGLVNMAQGRADDAAAAALLRMLAEFESRGQYASPAAQARNNVHALLRAEPEFQRMRLNRDATARLVTQCQRAKWIAPLDYRTPDRKERQRWTVTEAGRAYVDIAPTAPTAPTYHEGADSAVPDGGAPTAPTYQGGVGGERAHIYPDVSATAGGVNA